MYAEKLGELVGYVGGVQYAHKIIDSLEKLCSVEENTVRDMVSLCVEILFSTCEIIACVINLL